MAATSGYMEITKEIVQKSADYIRSQTDIKPKIGIILGTGLGQLGQNIDIKDTIEYENIPNFPVSTVESHKGRLLCGHLSDKPVIVMQGRFHFYEGYSLRQVTFPVRVMKELGIETLIVSNAAGGMNPQFKAGDIMVITDHINFLGHNPLIGPNDERLGPRFPDMYETYSKELIATAERVALDLKIPIKKGVYVSVAGPNLETAAEYRMLRIWGADAVGMSTVPEVIAARHQGTRVLGLSIITDMGLPDAMRPCSLEDVVGTASRTEPLLTDLVTGVVREL